MSVRSQANKRIHTVSFHVRNMLKYENRSNARTDSWLPGWRRGGDADHCGRKDDEGSRQPWADGYCHYPDRCDGFTSVCIYLYLSNRTF